MNVWMSAKKSFAHNYTSDFPVTASCIDPMEELVGVFRGLCYDAAFGALNHAQFCPRLRRSAGDRGGCTLYGGKVEQLWDLCERFGRNAALFRDHACGSCKSDGKL